MDPDPDAIFVLDIQDANKKQSFYFIVSASYFLKVHLHLFSKIKSQKESQNSRNQGFSYYFCLVIEGSRSGSRRPKNMWIRHTDENYPFLSKILNSISWPSPFKACISVAWLIKRAGFKQHVAKLSVTVDLLLGNIPERTSFLLPGLKAALAPYLQLAQVFLTRVGNKKPTQKNHQKWFFGFFFN
jgi:hypothetical protein